MPRDCREINFWIENENRSIIYDEPLAGDGGFYNFWHLPARRLALPILSKVYERGFDSYEKVELEDLKKEIEKIENFWKEKGIDEDVRYDFWERLSYFQEALRIALENQGSLSVC
ncbi:hypothetical protein MF271_16740 [Deinococcus sp. KNUC1210]|uniref:hypothetical protein n=1 Tax=Deinococcus sp. KNUC1210 TaxID=2917691 RepID=UPI001EEFD78A|nr:hypothetical protein [Deinococcus sp. KNUC1210]ULH15535.1 hypothetical protein MF271_16740 [Deinococcus sp. KNUC1210]